MSWSASFSGVGDEVARDAKRQLRDQKAVVGAGQNDSPRNAAIDATLAVVNTLAKQLQESFLEGEASGNLSEYGGFVELRIRARDAKEGDHGKTQTSRQRIAATEAAAAASAVDSGNVPSGSGDKGPKPPGQDGSTAVGQRSPANNASSKPSSGTPPRNA